MGHHFSAPWLYISVVHAPHLNEGHNFALTTLDVNIDTNVFEIYGRYLRGVLCVKIIVIVVIIIEIRNYNHVKFSSF